MYLLGIDCGGTSTEALLTTLEGRVLGRGHGGPANYTVNGVSGVLRSVREAMRGCWAQSGLEEAEAVPQITLAIGVSGAGRPSEQAELTEAFHPEGFTRVVVAHDAHIALLGALSGTDGVAVIAGTGSIAYGIHGERSHRVGGWGYLLGDEGGAFGSLCKLCAALCGPMTAASPKIRCSWRQSSPISTLLTQVSLSH